MKNKYIKYINEFQEWNSKWIEFVEDILVKYLETNIENQNDIEHILDFLYEKQDLDISQIWYETILEKANSFFTKRNLNAPKINEEKEWAVEIIKEWDNWFKIVKLITQEAYQREWQLMSHCVYWYYGRDTDIYSLRDERNYPHATIEKWKQIKWKGNNAILPKYVKYVVEFLEELWMNMREYEMKNIWYIDISFYKKIWILKEWLEFFREKFYFSDFKDIEDLDIFNCEVEFCDTVSEAKNKWLI